MLSLPRSLLSHKGSGKWTVVDDGGKEIAKDLNKEEVLSMAKEYRAA